MFRSTILKFWSAGWALLFLLGCRSENSEQALATPQEQARQFDFWIGDWDVENKRSDRSGTWQSIGKAKAEIRSVLNGRAIVEQWTGQGMLPIRGFSLRTFDPNQGRWEIILSWPSGPPAPFTMMVGNFRDGRGEFFPPNGSHQPRFSFSKATAHSCQWDQAIKDANGNFIENWIMEFERTGPPASLSASPDSAEALQIVLPIPPARPQPEARQLDRLIGVWTGEARRLAEDGSWETGSAHRRVSTILDGLGLLQLTSYSWGQESVAALVYDKSKEYWTEVGMSDEEADCHWLSGVVVNKTLRLNEISSSDNGVHHILSDMTHDAFVWTRERHSPGVDAVGTPDLVVRFSRADPIGRIDSVPELPVTTQTQLSQAQFLVEQQNYEAAEALLLSILESEPESDQTHFLLAYVLHAQQRYDEAMEHYLVSSKSSDSRLKSLSPYNMACIYSLSGETDAAIAQLRQAIKAGFADLNQLRSDPDFSNIREDSRFQAMLSSQVPDDELFAEPARIIRKWVGEMPGGQFGWIARRCGDWDDDGITDFVTTAPTFEGAGKAYVYSSRTGELLFEETGAIGQQFGNSAAGCGDVNGDGHPDLIVGAPDAATAGIESAVSRPGNAFVYSGEDGKLLHHFEGRTRGDRFGYAVCGAGDIDSDGHDDLIVGAAAANGKGPGTGAVFVYSGKTGKQLFRIGGERGGDFFGNAVAAARGPDGSTILAVGANKAGPRGTGRVYGYHIEQSKPALAFQVDGQDKSAHLGQMFLSFPGDYDEDGWPDLFASDFGDSSHAKGGGKVVIVSGKDGRELQAHYGELAGEGFGTSPSDAGDVNGDGVGDLIVGAWLNASAARAGGKAYLIDGKSGETLRTWTCRQSSDTFGFDACGIGDVDGDGAVDLLITSAWSRTRGRKTGRVFILAGTPDD